MRETGGQVEGHYRGERIAAHATATGRHSTITEREHHAGIPWGAGASPRKIQIQFRGSMPEVEVRPLAAYEMAVAGGAR